MSIFETVKSQIRAQETKLRGFHVRNIWLFGSAARGDAEVGDLDFLVEFEKAPGLMEFMELKFFLEELLGKEVDLHSAGSCPPRFFKRIQSELKHVA